MDLEGEWYAKARDTQKEVIRKDRLFRTVRDQFLCDRFKKTRYEVPDSLPVHR
jgi:hypothetical protein